MANSIHLGPVAGQTHPTQSTKIAIININAITAPTRQEMLVEFVKKQDFDLVLIQEVANLEHLQIPGYDAIYNIGPGMRGTAIWSKNEYRLHQVGRLPSGRATAVTYHDIRIVNIYAPSGTAKRADRERFYNNELPKLLFTNACETLMGRLQLRVASQRHNWKLHYQQSPS
jgi:exonuclease III